MDADFKTQCKGQDELLCVLVDEIARGCETIARLSDDEYRSVINGSSVGAQFRHNLDFVSNLIKGIESGRIDHSDRERDPFVEVDREYAISRFRKLAVMLNDLDGRVLGRSVLVRSELDASYWLPSSVAREVEFTHSHTVHHHALISGKLVSLGVQPIDDLGVAPSTLKYWAAKAV